MVLNLLTYVFLIFVAVTAFWFSAHLIGLDGPRNGPSGLAWLDAEDAFDRVRQQHRRHRLAAALHRQPHRLDLPTIRLSEAAGAGLLGPRNPREQLIPLSEIVGTADGAAGKFDRDFRPTDDRSRWRFQQIVIALRRGDAMPPIEVYRHRGGYYVSDGHHRVAAVRALGETSIAAHLTEVLWQPFPWQPFPSPHPGGTGLPDPPSPRDRDLPPPGPAGADHNLPRPGQARTVQWRATKPSGQAGVGALLR
jgi:ParB-like nuclease domain